MKMYLMRVVNANLSRFIKTTAVVMMLAVATGTSAQVTPASAGITDNEGKAIVTFVATGSESLLFDVKVDNASGEKFTIIVKDENGTTIYRGSFINKNFKKRFILPKTDSNKLTFHIKSESGITSESFEINTSTRIVEEVIVKKVI
ncbi:MAG TPA: hypothetical protein VM101_05930 [Flavitalea sp.]|nr:hypothetical protein [Flavitalea sp.]